jgi:uncharacterized protein (DUF1330 family)
MAVLHGLLAVLLVAQTTDILTSSNSHILELFLMPAYVIVEVEVHDPARYEAYKTMVPPSLAKYGGRFIVRGGEVTPLEGGWAPKRLVVIEFPSVGQAKAWWASPEYAEAKALRQATSTGRMIVVDGVPAG